MSTKRVMKYVIAAIVWMVTVFVLCPPLISSGQWDLFAIGVGLLLVSLACVVKFVFTKLSKMESSNV